MSTKKTASKSAARASKSATPKETADENPNQTSMDTSADKGTSNARPEAKMVPASSLVIAHDREDIGDKPVEGDDDSATMGALEKSVAAVGIQKRLLVWEKRNERGEPVYFVLDGKRRATVAQKLNLSEVPVDAYPPSWNGKGEDTAMAALLGNSLHKEMSAADKIRLIKRGGISEDRIRTDLGVSPSYARGLFRAASNLTDDALSIPGTNTNQLMQAAGLSADKQAPFLKGEFTPDVRDRQGNVTETAEDKAKREQKEKEDAENEKKNAQVLADKFNSDVALISSRLPAVATAFRKALDASNGKGVNVVRNLAADVAEELVNYPFNLPGIFPRATAPQTPAAAPATAPAATTGTAPATGTPPAS